MVDGNVRTQEWAEERKVNEQTLHKQEAARWDPRARASCIPMQRSACSFSYKLTFFVDWPHWRMGSLGCGRGKEIEKSESVCKKLESELGQLRTDYHKLTIAVAGDITRCVHIRMRMYIHIHMHTRTHTHT